MHSKMTTYFDNNVLPGQTYAHIDPVEMAALQSLQSPPLSDRLLRVTSRHSTREQERVKDLSVRERLEKARQDLSMVEKDHMVLGSATLEDGHGGCICNPLVSDLVDESIFRVFQSEGLRSDDAQHLMYAVHNCCDRFVTLDKDFLGKRDRLEAHCRGMKIVKPSELVPELARR